MVDITVRLEVPDCANSITGLWWICLRDRHQVIMNWRNLTFSVLCKWRWYFEYRAALHKVQNPRADIQLTNGREVEVPTALTEIISLQNGLSWVKGQVTKMQNKIAVHVATMETKRNDWKKKYPLLEPYPIEQDREYQRYEQALVMANQKLAGKQQELADRIERIAELKQSLTSTH